MSLNKLLFVGLLAFSLVLFCSGCTETGQDQRSEFGALNGSDTAEGAGNEGAEGESTGTDGNIIVAVSILPQAEFVEAVGGDRVQTIVMIPPGASPATHDPTPGQLRDISEARMYAIMGSGLAFEEVWLDKLEVINGEMLVVDCSKGIPLRDMETHFHEGDEAGVRYVNDEEYGAEEAGEHDAEEGAESEHEHSGKDPHIWNSPVNAKLMVENIYQGLVQIDPANETYYRQNRDVYLSRLDVLDAKIRKDLEGRENSTFMVFHPSWGYFADEYGLTMLPIEIEGKEPSVQDLARMVDLAKEKDIRVIFIQAQFSPRSAEAVAEEIGGEVVVVDPLAPNYLENMEEVSGIFARNLA